MSNWELLHELDTAVMSTDNMYTFANIGEVLPDCVTPLTGTTVIQSLQSATMKIVRSSLPYGGRFLAAFARTHHRVMFDIYEIILVQRQQNISLADKILAYAIAGNDYITPEIHRVSVQRHGFQSGRQILAELLSTTVQLWYNKTIVEQLERFMGKLAGRFSDATKLQREFDGFNADQFAAEIDFELDDVDRMETALNTHSKVTKVSTFSQIITLLVLAEGADDLSATHLTDIGLILSTCNDVESAEVPNMLEEIANEIYLAGVMDEFLALAPEDGAKWLSMRCAAAGRMLNNFISRHGHRAIKEVRTVWILNCCSYFDFTYDSYSVAVRAGVHHVGHAAEPGHLDGPVAVLERFPQRCVAAEQDASQSTHQRANRAAAANADTTTDKANCWLAIVAVPEMRTASRDVQESADCVRSRDANGLPTSGQVTGAKRSAAGRSADFLSDARRVGTSDASGTSGGLQCEQNGAGDQGAASHALVSVVECSAIR